MKTIFALICLLTMSFGVGEAIANNANDNSVDRNNVQQFANVQEVLSFENKRCIFAERGRPHNSTWYSSLYFLNEGKEFEITMSLPSGEPGSNQMQRRFAGSIVQISEYKSELYEEDGSFLGTVVNYPAKKLAILEIGSYVSEGSLCFVAKLK